MILKRCGESATRRRRTVRRIVAIAIPACFLVLASALAAAAAQDGSKPVRVAVFDFELIDTSLEGEIRGTSETEAARLAMLGEQLRHAFAATPEYSLVDIKPVRETAGRRNLQSCGGCDRTLAAQIGADLAVTGTVQKVSNLILNINIYVRDVATGERIQVASADIRGNTDESWRRGLQWLIKNRLKLEPRP